MTEGPFSLSPGPLNLVPFVLVLHPVFQVSAVMADIAGHGNPLHHQRPGEEDAVGEVAVGVVRDPDDIRGAADGAALGIFMSSLLNGGPSTSSTAGPQAAKAAEAAADYLVHGALRTSPFSSPCRASWTAGWKAPFPPPPLGEAAPPGERAGWGVHPPCPQESLWRSPRRRSPP